MREEGEEEINRGVWVKVWQGGGTFIRGEFRFA